MSRGPAGEDGAAAAPDEFPGGPEERARARSYMSLRYRWAAARLVLDLAAVTVFALSPLPAAARDALGAGAGGPAATALYVAVLYAGARLLALPLAYLSGYGPERRYGLARHGPVTWLGDYAKATVVGAAAAAASGAAVVAVAARSGRWWWLAAAAALAGLSALLALVWPAWILPLFLPRERAPEGDMTRRARAVAERAGVRAAGVWIVRAGTRSSKANAFLAGIGPTRGVYLWDTLVEGFTPDEVEAVVAHELGHHVRGHIGRGLAITAAGIAGALYVADRLLAAVGPRLGLRGPADPAALPFVAMVVAAGAFLVTPAANALSRQWEREADRDAVSLASRPEAFAAALARLGRRNLSDPAPPRPAVWLFYDHPPLAERIAAARAGAARRAAEAGGRRR